MIICSSGTIAKSNSSVHTLLREASKNENKAEWVREKDKCFNFLIQKINI